TIRAALRYPGFRMLLSGLAVSQAGDWLYNLALVAASSLPIVAAPVIAAIATVAATPYLPAVSPLTPRLVADADLPGRTPPGPWSPPPASSSARRSAGPAAPWLPGAGVRAQRPDVRGGRADHGGDPGQRHGRRGVIRALGLATA